MKKTSLISSAASVLQMTVPAPPPDDALRAAPRLPLSGTRADQILWWIVEATSGYTGDEFFNSLVSHLALALKLKYVFITECLNHPVTRVRTLARWSGKGLMENVEYNLEGQPCDETIQGREVCFYPDRVNEVFPAKRGTDRVSYYGIPILDAAHEHVIGHLAFFDDKKMENEVFDNPIFHIFANRAAAELQRRRAEEDSRAHLQHLAHMGRVGSMGDLASAIAHEVNQPLAAITSYARVCEMLVSAGPDMPPDMREAVTGILAQAERAAAITRRLRGFLRDGEVNAARIDPNRIAQESAELARADARKRGVMLETQFDFTLPDVRGDAVQIQQVVFNLIRNAQDALNEHTASVKWVMVSTRRSSENPNLIEITVTDNGPGVAPGIRDKLFDPFFTTKADGMGIGLSLARTIAHNAGGRLALDASHEGGARFVLTLPAAPD